MGHVKNIPISNDLVVNLHTYGIDIFSIQARQTVLVLREELPGLLCAVSDAISHFQQKGAANLDTTTIPVEPAE